MTSHKELNWKIFDTPDAVADACVNTIIKTAEESIAQRGAFHLVLAGGTTPKQAYQQLAEKSLDWSKWYFYYGDERCLGIDNAERNSLMAQQAWLDKIDLDNEHHFPIPAELGAEKGAEQYLDMIGKDRVFDLVLLGMGEDGHTASLFPNQSWQADAKVIAVHDSPKPPADRVSLGPALIHTARHRLFMVSGAGKAEAIQQWRKDADLPIKLAARPGDSVLIDKSAWGDD